MIINHPALGRVLKIAFEAVWDTGLTLDEAYEHLGIAATDGK